jgi:hypothetical protein
MGKTKKSKREDKRDPSVKRLDAILRLSIEIQRIANSGFTEKDAAILLNSVGLTPTEIAVILGKKSKDAINPYLYGREKKKKQSKK